MADKEPTIVIKKIVKGGHGHHGGAWKVAYADFVTAMMAFFLLLWLLSATTDEQKLGISNYFSPEAVSTGQSGSGGLFGGTSISVEGALTSSGGPSAGSAAIPLPPSPPSTGIDEEEGIDSSEGEDTEGEATEEALKEYLAAREQEQFEAAQAALHQAMANTPELAGLQDSLLIDLTPEGLRIQFVDQERVSMFASGSAEPNDATRRLADLVTKVVDQLPNKISVSGHTDGVPYHTSTGYTNWELSADRANAARRLMLDSGLDEGRITLVQGRADTDHLFPDEPESPRNRRVSVVLLRQDLDNIKPDVGPLPENYGD
ncbi:MAG: flagellar motor protein MotB [Alphaproteobacteria bacterium]